MTDIYINQKLDGQERRRLIFDGSLFLYTGMQSTAALCAHALDTVREAFDTKTPDTAFTTMPVEAFVAKAQVAKKTFTNGLRSKELIRDFVRELGSAAEDYYFDVPRLRIVPPFEYLHAGVSYAYAAHRDTWYGGPVFQINHWMPVLPIKPEQTMALYPAYFRRSVKNTSDKFDLSHWVNVERARAVTEVKEETRVHPLPVEDVDASSELRLAGGTGDIMVFSGTQLHATVPNHTTATRFSVDFRLYHVEDIAGRGEVKHPQNIDSRATSEDFGMSSCFSVSDFSSFRSEQT